MSKHENVLEQVYEPRRLLEAWQQVKTNAGAAGIDRMSVCIVLSPEWFQRMGLVFLDDFRPASLKES